MTPTRTGEYVRMRLPLTRGQRMYKAVYVDRRGRKVVRWRGDWWTIRRCGTVAEWELDRTA